VHSAPPIGQFSNREFGAHVDHLLEAPSRLVAIRVRPRQTCACGCDEAVVAPRKFLNQERYSAWLSQVRYFGRTLDSPDTRQSRRGHHDSGRAPNAT
jgi:hypothetical protein